MKLATLAVLGFLSLLCGAIRVAPVYAQFGAVLVKGAVAEEEADGEEEDAEDAEEMQGRGAAGNAGLVGRVRVQRLQPEVFDQWVFNGTNAQETRNRMNSLLTMRISDIDRVSPLSQDQSQKLQLAGKLDIKRLFDQVEAGRRRFEVSNRANQGNAALIHRDVQPLRQLLAKEAFTEGSVFDKAVRGLLSSDQLPQYRKLLDDRKTYRQRALRESILLTLDKQIPLREEQRKKLRELLDESRPVNPGQFESHAMWFVASKLPDEKYRAILSDPQWNLLKARFAQVQGLEQFLIQNGALGDVEEAKPAAGGF